MWPVPGQVCKTMVTVRHKLMRYLQRTLTALDIGREIGPVSMSLS